MSYYMQVIEFEYPHSEGDGDRVVKQVGPFASRREAELCEDGFIIMEPGKFCTQIVEDDDDE